MRHSEPGPTMFDPTTKCLDCGASMLFRTAMKTGGKCIPCANGTRAEIERSKVRAAEEREWRRKSDEALARINRKARPTYSDFLAEDDPIGVLWLFLVAKVFQTGLGHEEVEFLTPSAKALYLVQMFDGEVFSGGFVQYFSSSSGRFAHEALDALHELGVRRRAELLQRAIYRFPNKRVSSDHAQRDEELSNIDPNTLDTLDGEYYAVEESGSENLLASLLTFMRQHATERIVV